MLEGSFSYVEARIQVARIKMCYFRHDYFVLILAIIEAMSCKMEALPIMHEPANRFLINYLSCVSLLNQLPYLPYEFGTTDLSKQYRPR